MEHHMDISHTIHMLGDLLGKVISDLESPALFEIEERIRAEAKSRRAGDPSAAQRLQKLVSALSADEARAVASAFATYFDLVNLAEDNQRVQLLNKKLEWNYPEPIDESIGEAIAKLKARGITNEQMSTLLENLSIELVLTAHPTEARRRTVLSKIEHTAQLLQEISNKKHSKRNHDALLAALQSEISALWLTERARANLGPTLIEHFTYRGGPHSTSDDPAKYRPADEGRQWPLGDPIERLRDHLVSLGEWSEEQHKQAQEEAVELVRATGREAEKVGVLSTEAPQRRAEMFEDVYKDVPWHLAQQRDEGA